MDSPVNHDPLLSVEQAAAYLSCSVRMIRRLTSERRLSYVKVGRHVRFRLSALDEFIRDGSIERVWR